MNEEGSTSYKKTAESDRNIVSEPYIAWGLSDAAMKINQGLFTDVLSTIQSRLHISNQELSELIMISPRTLDRRKKEKTLPPDESERCYRVARLTDLAVQVFEDDGKAANWFGQPNYALGNKRPIELIKTEPGARLVERLLGQIEHGITV
jgi:putative toxin-antitoxin system antitoxin component (TIGR02293 family)